MSSASSSLPSGGLRAEASAALDWLDDATDGRLRAPLRIEVVRPLTADDHSGQALAPAQPPTLRETKASHHQLAKLVASGRSHVEASRITGYSPSYISRLSADPMFRELVLHYSEVGELAATDFLGAMRSTGLDLLDELRKRVEDDPTVLTTSQLYDGIKLLLVEPMKSEAMRAGTSGAGVAPITISFVASATPQASGDARVIDGDIIPEGTK